MGSQCSSLQYDCSVWLLNQHYSLPVWRWKVVCLCVFQKECLFRVQCVHVAGTVSQYTSCHDQLTGKKTDWLSTMAGRSRTLLAKQRKLTGPLDTKLLIGTFPSSAYFYCHMSVILFVCFLKKRCIRHIDQRSKSKKKRKPALTRDPAQGEPQGQGRDWSTLGWNMTLNRGMFNSCQNL